MARRPITIVAVLGSSGGAFRELEFPILDLLIHREDNDAERLRRFDYSPTQFRLPRHSQTPGRSMALAAFGAAPDLKEILESLLPDILIAVQTTLSRLHHRSANDEVGDLCQQVTVLLLENDFRRLRSFDYRSSRRTWLTAVVRNYVMNHVRRQKPTVSLNDLRADVRSYPAMQDQRLIAQEQSESLRAASTKLTKRELELFELCYVADLSTGEIAEEMGIKLQSVRRRKHALVKKLQGFLELPQPRTLSLTGSRR